MLSRGDVCVAPAKMLTTNIAEFQNKSKGF